MLSLSHLIYGRNIANIPNIGHYKVFSSSSSLNTRAKHHFNLLSHFTKQWRKQYFLSLREVPSSGHKTSSEKLVRIGDVVIVYDEFSRRVFWRLGMVTKLLTGSDGITGAAIVKTVNSDHTRLLCRSIKHLIPIELTVNIQDVNSEEDSHELVRVPVRNQGSSCDPTMTNRRAAAVIGERR